MIKRCANDVNTTLAKVTNILVLLLFVCNYRITEGNDK